MNYKNLIIDNFETLYEINPCGEIRNKKRQKILKQQNSKGYMRVGLSINKKPKTLFVHRLVALTFVKNEDPDKYNIVNHLDGNPLNNRASNLEWTTQQGNTQHAWDTGLAKPSTERSVTQYSLKGLKIAEYRSATEAARSVEGTSQPKITECCLGNRNTHGEFQWRYSIEGLEKLKEVSVNVIKSKKVLQLLDGQVIKEHVSTRQAAKDVGGTQSAISRCCNGLAKTHKGFEWKFS